MYLEQVLNGLSTAVENHQVFIPGIWTDINLTKPVKVDYASFIIDKIKGIITHNEFKNLRREVGWTDKAIVYNLFVRYFTAYDHDQDGALGNSNDDITINGEGLRETGTFLKTIALLPYLKGLGINTIHLLPITKIGIEGRKGDLGSPYAIKNPFEIDPLLADPIIDLPITAQYSALIEAAHLLGIRVVQEFIFRTASIDSDWTTKNPDWFYWINKETNYGPPQFTPKQLEKILKIPKGKGEFIAPNKSYRDLFSVPAPNTDYCKLKIASAFADWPPNDLQPPWTDVTYLKLYQYDTNKENNYNYIAYNTIRYYDPELAKQENINHELWDKIVSIIPYYQNTFGIDGAMIDMGHALPNQLKSKIIHKAREIDPAFAFWDENFDNKEGTKKEGYNAAIGDAWYKITKRNGFKNIITKANKSHPLPFFGAAETHNSPRFGYNNQSKKKSAWLLFKLLPNAIPFMHNGFELNEQLPVNTGLNFTKEEIKFFSDQPLALFYKTSLGWDGDSNIVSFIKRISKIECGYPWIFSEAKLSVIHTNNSKVLGFEIKNNSNHALALFNTNFYKKESFVLDALKNQKYHDLFHEKTMDFSQESRLKKGGMILALLD